MIKLHFYDLVNQLRTYRNTIISSGVTHRQGIKDIFTPIKEQFTRIYLISPNQACATYGPWVKYRAMRSVKSYGSSAKTS